MIPDPKLGFAPWVDDPDPPDELSDADIEKMAEGVARWAKGEPPVNTEETAVKIEDKKQ